MKVYIVLFISVSNKKFYKQNLNRFNLLGKIEKCIIIILLKHPVYIPKNIFNLLINFNFK